MAVALQDRIQRLTRELQNSGYDAYFASTKISLGYLHGFFEDGHERFLTLGINRDGQVWLICPALSESQARRSGIERIDSWRDGEDPMPLFESMAEEWNLRSGIIAVDDEMPAQMLLKMQAVLPAALFKPGQPIISQLMRRKDERELALMRKSAAIADKAFHQILPQIKGGMTELQLTKIINDAMSQGGGTPTFCIVATGKASAEPHHASDETVIQHGDVVILDFGCSVECYQSDITRTIAVGSATDEQRKVYRVVYDAFMAGRNAAREGATAGSVDAAARKVIDDAGYGEYFVHRTGHGIGMRGHEEPYIVGGSDFVLEAGNCFSIEPGIYMPGSFGVRIETIACATPSGHENLNEEPSAELVVVPG